MFESGGEFLALGFGKVDDGFLDGAHGHTFTIPPLAVHLKHDHGPPEVDLVPRL